MSEAVDRRKPRIYKAESGWTVELPGFGFRAAEVKNGLDTWESAGRWLAKRDKTGVLGGQFDRTYTPDGYWKSAYHYTNWPVVVR